MKNEHNTTILIYLQERHFYTSRIDIINELLKIQKET